MPLAPILNNQWAEMTAPCCSLEAEFSGTKRTFRAMPRALETPRRSVVKRVTTVRWIMADNMQISSNKL